MEVAKILKTNLKGFFKQSFKVDRIEPQLTKADEILVVLKFASLSSEVFVVCDHNFNLKYIF